MDDLTENEEMFEDEESLEESKNIEERNENYVVSRNNVYTGILVQGYKIKRSNEDFFERRTGEYFLESFNPYRSIIFNLNEDRMALDLLYDTPLVPVLNYCDVTKVFPNKFIVDYAVNVGLLLERLGFEENLKYDDILKFKDMLNEDVLKENVNLFKENKNNTNLGLKKLLVKLSFNFLLKEKAVSTINDSMTVYDFLKLERTLNSRFARIFNEEDLNPFEPSVREKVKSLKQE